MDKTNFTRIYKFSIRKSIVLFAGDQSATTKFPRRIINFELSRFATVRQDLSFLASQSIPRIAWTGRALARGVVIVRVKSTHRADTRHLSIEIRYLISLNPCFSTFPTSLPLLPSPPFPFIASLLISSSSSSLSLFAAERNNTVEGQPARNQRWRCVSEGGGEPRYRGAERV